MPRLFSLELNKLKPHASKQNFENTKNSIKKEIKDEGLLDKKNHMRPIATPDCYVLGKY